MLNMFVKILGGFISILKIPILVIMGVILFFGFLVLVNIVILRFKGYKLPKHSGSKPKQKSVLKRVFYDAPKQFALDSVNKEADFFDEQGLIIFTGRQGRGKSIGIAEYALRLQEQYPKAMCISNIDYKYQNVAINHWRQMVNIKNGIYGLIVILDELQNWFSSNQSRSFPPEMLSVITQNRKHRRIMLGTAQSFHLLAKSIRSQTTEVRECFTVAGVLTFVRRREPILNSDGDVQEWKNRGFYFFVHDNKIRESYDTWQVTESLIASGFRDKDYLKEDINVVVNM